MTWPSLPKIEPSPLTWRQCFWLCLPALIIGAVLRISLLVAIPEGYYGPDTNSYLHTALTLWDHQEIAITAKRRWLYPIVLAAAPAFPGRMVAVVPVAQHLLGLTTILAIGFITGHLVRRPRVWVPVVTGLAAVWPRMLWYEHEILAEVLLLALFVWTVALAFPLGALNDRRRLCWFIIGTAVTVATKPAGKPLWIGLLLTAVLLAGNPLRWGWKNWTALAGSLLMFATVGASKQGNWLLLSSTLPLIPTEGEKWATYRTAIRGDVEKARADLDQYAWLESTYKKTLSMEGAESPYGPEWGKMVLSNRAFSEVARSLALEAIVHSPVAFGKLVVQKIGLVASNDNAGGSMNPRVFWKRQSQRNQGLWARQPDRMRLMYEMDETAYNAMVAERATRTLWFAGFLAPFTEFMRWTEEVKGERNSTPIQWPGWLFCFGLATCFVPGRCRATTVLWLPLLLYVGIIFSIGDAVSRYLQPIEWIALIFVALGLDFACSALVSAWRALRRLPAPLPPDDVPAPTHN